MDVEALDRRVTGVFILPAQKVLVVATPRTGSRSLMQAIEDAKFPGAHKTKVHHDWPHEVSRAASGGNYEVWSIIREPLHQLRSWIYHAGMDKTPDKFIRQYKNRYFFYEGGMNIYNRVVHRYFVFENNGHARLLNALGASLEPHKIPWIGRSNSLSDDLGMFFDDSCVAMAKDRFKLDFELYDLWREKDVLDTDDG